jgi:hypothetical protein
MPLRNIRKGVDSDKHEKLIAGFQRPLQAPDRIDRVIGFFEILAA